MSFVNLAFDAGRYVSEAAALSVTFFVWLPPVQTLPRVEQCLPTTFTKSGYRKFLELAEWAERADPTRSARHKYGCDQWVKHGDSVLF